MRPRTLLGPLVTRERHLFPVPTRERGNGGYSSVPKPLNECHSTLSTLKYFPTSVGLNFAFSLAGTNSSEQNETS